ncbi:MAG: sec-independent protein translocase protein TatC [Saprospiraceae bacterium]|jgi:sec-independent protein translocase protein TatC
MDNTGPNSTHKQNQLSFLEHLEILRFILMRIVGVITVLSIFVFSFKEWVFDTVVFAPLSSGFWTYQKLCSATHYMHEILPSIINAEAGCFGELSLQVIAPKMTTQFMTALMVSFIGGVIFSFPYIIWEIWKFIKPALYNKEQKKARGIVWWTSLLFALGILFGYYFIAPMSIHFLGNFSISSQVQNLPSLNSYMGILASTTLASGIIFELPILVFFLSKIGLLTPELMKKYRKHAFVVTLLLAAIITPPDVFSQVLICIPIVILYEISIYISRYVQRQKSKEG